MRMKLLAKTLLGTAAAAALAAIPAANAAADETKGAPPSLPLSTSSRWILDSTGARVKLTCVNWAGHMEAHIPEGLHKQPVEAIAGAIADQGFNCVRLTYSIDHALDPGLKVADAFAHLPNATGISQADADGLYGNVTEKNPFVAEGGGASAGDVYARVVKALWDRGVMTILDNHVSKASWCCDLKDGNGWWDTAFGYTDLNSRYFHTQDWLNGLTAMATWANDQPGVIGFGLRNEVRELLLQGTNGREDWYNYMGQAAKAVHGANPDALILMGGTLSSTDLIHIKARTIDWSGWAGKHVWEWHAYSFTVNFPNSGGDCGFTQGQYGFNVGFVLEQGKDYTAPLILTEFGFGQAGGDQANGLNDKDNKYFSCLKDYVLQNDSEWALWGIMGSYYVRDGKVDYDEPYGVLDRDWTNLRNAGLGGLLGDMFNMTQGP